MFFFDPVYMLYVFIPTMLLSLGVQLYLKRSYAKWSKVRNSTNLTGTQVGEALFQRTNLMNIPLEVVPGQMTDHFDPRANVVRLSQGTASQPSVAAMAIAAHELGHVQQYQTGSALIKARNFLVPAERLSANGFKTVVDIDLLGAFNASRAAFAQLKATRGCIIYVSAGQAYTPYAFQVHVAAAKAGIDMMMRNLALEWGRYGIRVNSIVPGPIEGTEGMKRLANPAVLEQIRRAVPLQRLGTVDDIGQMCAVLASPLASYVTGTVLVADGGQNLEGSALFNRGAEQILKANG